MGSLTGYFERIAYKPEYFIGDRVFGTWNGIPFVGSVGNDRDWGDGPKVSIGVDLPIMFEGEAHRIIVVKHEQIKLLKEFE